VGLYGIGAVTDEGDPGRGRDESHIPRMKRFR
jgi:hypothetical protein